MEGEAPSVTGEMLLQAKGATLISHLKTLQEELANIEQTDDHGFLQSCAEALGSNKLLRNRDSDVKLLTACCLSDVLRVYAPETPFSRETLKVVFETFVSQLRGVAEPNGPSFPRYFYLLERLAMVKSFVLMIDLRCDDLVRQLFETAFEAINPEHSIRVENHLLDILITTLEELDAVPQPLIDAILENLIQQAKVEKPAAYALARGVLQRCSKELQQPIHEFLQGCLPSGSATLVESDLRDEWPRLILELTDVSPDYVCYLLPQIEETINIEEESIRLKGIELLAQLFTLSSANVLRDFPQLLQAFLHKFHDVSATVRSALVLHSICLARERPDLASSIIPSLKERIMDPDERVRAILVKSVCEACTETLMPFAPLLSDLGHRMRDKRPAVKSAAREGLCTLYCRHVSALLREQSDASRSPEALRWLPQQLMDCYGAESRDPDSRLELETLLHSTLLPAAAELRLPALCLLHQELQPLQRKALLALLRAKRTAQQQMARWVELQGLIKAKRPGDAEARDTQAKLVSSMCAEMPEPAKARDIWETMRTSKDQRLLKDLVALSSPSSSFAEQCEAKDDLRRRLAQRLKGDQLPLLEAIALRPAMLLLCRESAQKLLQDSMLLLQKSTAQSTRSADASLSLLVEMSSVFPELLSQGGTALAEALQATQQASESQASLVAQLLRVTHEASRQLATESPSTRKQLVASLCQRCCGKDPQLGKLAAQCLTTELLVPQLRERTFATLLQKLLPALNGKAGAQQHCALNVISVFAKRLPSAFGAEREPLLEQLLASISEHQGSVTGAQLKARCESQRLALKVLANEMISSAGSVGEAGEGEEGQSDERARMLERCTGLIDFCSKLIAAKGVLGAAAAASKAERAALRLTAACALLKMARLPVLHIDLSLGPKRWHALALCMQDPEASVRTGMAAKLHAELMRPFIVEKRELKRGAPQHFLNTRKLGLSPHYMVLFALAANDTDKTHVQATKGWLSFTVRNWRRAAQQYKAPRLMPEMQLPYLIHLLAHHPHFKQEAKDDPCLSSTQRCLDFFIGTLITGASEFDLLRNVVGRVKRATDRAAPDGDRVVHVASDVAREIIAQRGKGIKWSHTPVPPILLPATLYYRPEERKPFPDHDMIPHGFKLLDSVGRKAEAQGSAAAAPAAIAGNGKKLKSPRSGTPKLLEHKAVPSPLPSGSGSKRRWGGKRASESESEGDGEEEDGGEDGDEDEEHAAEAEDDAAEAEEEEAEAEAASEDEEEDSEGEEEEDEDDDMSERRRSAKRTSRKPLVGKPPLKRSKGMQGSAKSNAPSKETTKPGRARGGASSSRDVGNHDTSAAKAKQSKGAAAGKGVATKRAAGAVIIEENNDPHLGRNKAALRRRVK